MRTTTSAQPEFSRPFAVDRLGAALVTETIEANAEERARLVERFGLVALDRLVASIGLQAEQAADLIHVSGRLEADVVQTCVVTLEPFPTHVEDSFSVDFSRSAEEFALEADLDMDYEPPEPIENGIIDTGELVAQFLSLSLDPHPRAPGVALEHVYEGPEANALSPFAALAALKSAN